MNTGLTVLGHMGRDWQSDQYIHRIGRGNVRTLAYLMIHEHVMKARDDETKSIKGRGIA